MTYMCGATALHTALVMAQIDERNRAMFGKKEQGVAPVGDAGMEMELADAKVAFTDLLEKADTSLQAVLLNPDTIKGSMAEIANCARNALDELEGWLSAVDIMYEEYRAKHMKHVAHQLLIEQGAKEALEVLSDIGDGAVKNDGGGGGAEPAADDGPVKQPGKAGVPDVE